jgi:cell filamentation protein
MSQYSFDKSYIYYENTNIPINKLDIHDLNILEEKERELLLKGYKYFHTHLAEETIFDEVYLRGLHKKTFDKLYNFAGKYRESNISKGYSTFCQVRFLTQTSKAIFNKLGHDNYLKDYSNKPKNLFAKKIAYYMCELIALHPFYELNGRVIRLFFDMITTYNGYEYINYEDALKIENGDNKFIQASIDCMVSNDDTLYKIILNGLVKSE